MIVAAVAATVFFADHPGHVEIVWQGRQLDTSVGVLVAALFVFALLVAALTALLGAVRRLPRTWRRHRAERRRVAADRALTRGLVALAAGQAGEARVQARRVETLIGEVPVGLLLAAEAAQRQGDPAAAQRAYSALLDRSETEFLGIRGLLGQAVRAGDNDVARRLAERARVLRPDARWVVESLLILQARAGDWEAARQTLAGSVRRGALPNEIERHHRGVVLYELSRVAERQGDTRQAAALAGKALSLVPDLPGPAAARARLQLQLGHRRRAIRTIERAWRTAPHPELARLYLQTSSEAAPLARAAALLRLSEQNPSATESHVAIGEAALAAQLWGEARRHLAIAAGQASPAPSRQLCLLMARLEESPDGDYAAARDWLDRAMSASSDSCYVCGACALESLVWHALCPHCGELDTLRWRRSGAGGRMLATSGAGGLAPLILPASNIAGDMPGGAGAMPNSLAAATQSDNNPPQAGIDIAPIAQR